MANKPSKLIKDVTFDFEDKEGLGPHVAYTVLANGGAASGKNDVVCLKSESETSPEDILKNLEQVTVTLSFEEFLRKFFDMWYDDATILTKLLGFETQEEYWAKENECEPYECSWITDKVNSIKLLKGAKDNSISIEDKIKLIPLRKQFEEGLAKLEAESTEENVEPTPEGAQQSSSLTEVNKNEVVNNDTTSIELETTDGPKGENMSDTTNKVDFNEVFKSQEAQDFLKGLVEGEVTKATKEANATIANQTALIKSLQEKEDQRVQKGLEVLTKSFTALEVDVQKSLQEVLFKNVTTEGMDVVIDAMKTMQEAVEKAKEDFATVETGIEGTVDVVESQVVKSSLMDSISNMVQDGYL